MTPEEYEKGALATEAPADNGCLIRIKSQAMQFGKLLNELSKMGSKADRLKKLAFYGKALTRQQLQPVLKLDMESNFESFDAFLQDRNMARLLHAWIGLVTEASEIGNVIIECLMSDNPLELLNVRNIKEELGDSQWYIVVGANAVGCSLETLMKDNNKKLFEKRFSSGKFSSEEAAPENRDTKNEVSHIEASEAKKHQDGVIGSFTIPGNIDESTEQHEPFIHTCYLCGRQLDIAPFMDRLLRGEQVFCPCTAPVVLPKQNNS